MEELTLHYGLWNELSAVALRQAISSVHNKLTVLNINGYEMADYTMHLLAAGLLSSECRVEELDLSLNDIGNAGAEQLARVLSSPNNSVLRVLHLKHNRIGNAGAVALANAFAVYRD